MLSKEQLQSLHHEGFLVVDNVLDAATDLDPILREMEEILDRLVIELQQQGTIPSTLENDDDDMWADLPFGERLCHIIKITGESYSQHFDFSLPKGHVDADAPLYLGEALFRLLTHPKILDCMQDVLGTTEIYSNPVQHVRLKPPELVAPSASGRSSVLVNETPWHQDNAVLTTDADETNVWTVWIPLGVDVTERYERTRFAWVASLDSFFFTGKPHTTHDDTSFVAILQEWLSQGCSPQSPVQTSCITLPHERRCIAYS